MTWDAIATFVLAFVTLVGLNLATMRWLFTQHGAQLTNRLDMFNRDGSEFARTVERELLRLKAQLPTDYVRREDWIRFSNTLEAKLDALRAEVRLEIGELRERLYERGSAAGNDEITA